MAEGNNNPHIDLYNEIALRQAQRILGLGDRDPSSETYGCFDRYYWHYRQVDFTNARFQEASHYLALLHVVDHPKNRFHKKSIIKDWANASVRYWAWIQVPDGSFNENWPNERSISATVFSTYAIAETCRLLVLNPPGAQLRKACQWIHSHQKCMESNQLAASAAALLLTSILLNDKTIRQFAEQQLDSLLSLQHPEGYFIEHNEFGTDCLTITLSYLAEYYIHHSDPRIEDAMRKAFRFLDDNIQTDGTCDYENNGRKTQHFFPYGFVVLNEWELLNRHLNGLAQNQVLQPAWLDDRNCLPVATNYLRTALYANTYV